MEGRTEEVSVEVISYRREVERATEKAMKKAARMIGGSISGHAVELCPVDTGLLHNSITFALGGDAPDKSVYYDDNMEQMGEYDGTAPMDDDHEITVYIGTNVQYAPYNELGTVRMDARPVIRPAMENTERGIEQIIRQCLGEIG